MSKFKIDSTKFMFNDEFIENDLEVLEQISQPKIEEPKKEEPKEDDEKLQEFIAKYDKLSPFNKYMNVWEDNNDNIPEASTK